MKKYEAKRKSMFWHRAKMSGHMERALRPDNPKFLRLADLAVAFAGANGHAQFEHGELTRFLEARDSRTVDEAIAQAVRYGYLAPGSNRRCLRVPAGLMELHAGAGSDDDKVARRTRPCETCAPGTIARPAECHPQRRRYSSRGECQSCYRKRRRNGD